MGSVKDWDYIAEHLKADFCLLTVDLPGHGQSFNLDNSKYTIESASQAIVDILKDISIDKCCLAAYSMGGRIGYYLLVHFPEFFDKAIIESSTPGIADESERVERIASDKKLAEKLLSQPLEQFVTAWYRLPLFESLDKSSLAYHNLYERRLLNNPNTLAKSLLHMGTGAMPPLWEKLDQIACELLLIVGGKDEKFKTIADAVHKKIKISEVVTITNAGHNVHFEQSDQFIKALKKFLK